MCTVTIIPLPAHADSDNSGFRGYRLVTNRDESRRRPPALPPRTHEFQWGRALWPIDAQAGGTWVAASSRALTLAILSSRPPQEPPQPTPRADAFISRGRIIPRLIDAPDAVEAAERLSAHPLSSFDAFRLVAVDGSVIVHALWDRRTLHRESFPLEPACFASSGLGDHLVLPRVDLFDDWRRERPMTPERQDAFHRHAWPDRPEISVRMDREDARTVSTTVVDVRCGNPAAHVAMTYIADAEESYETLAGCEPSRAEMSGERA